MVLPEPTGPPMPMRGERLSDMRKGFYPQITLMNLEQQSRSQTVQGVFPADDADETDGAKTFKRGVRKGRGADGGLASFISACSAISALKTSWLLFPEIHPRPSALSAENCRGSFVWEA